VSVLVGAGRQATVPVSCVERGRWDGSRHAEHFAPAPHAAPPELRATKRHRANAAFAAGAPARPDQAEVWAHVESRAASVGAASPTGAQRATFDARAGDIEALAGGLKPLDEQIGAIAQVGGRCVALDLVSRPDVYRSLAGRLVRGYVLDALDRPAAPPDDHAAGAFLARVLDAPRAEVATPGFGASLVISGRGVEGSGLTHDDELIQLSAFPNTHESHPGAIARPSHRRRRIV
jgi:ARG and Rhodanese-Phosphatase-superfamily-associated Protein domain